jgi:hypothetical protein
MWQRVWPRGFAFKTRGLLLELWNNEITFCESIPTCELFMLSADSEETVASGAVSVDPSMETRFQSRILQ